MWEAVELALLIIIMVGIIVGIFYFRCRITARNYKKIMRLLQNSTSLIKDLFNEAGLAEIREIKVLSSFFAESKIFPKQKLRLWTADPILREITVPLKDALSLLEHKYFAMFELHLSHEIGHFIVGIERLVLQRECNLSGFCLSDEIRAWQKSLEIIDKRCGGIKNWRPQFGDRELTLDEVFNYIENVIAMECNSECQKFVESQKCPRANDVLAAKMHIKRILNIQA